jgi:hypothetical protein
MSHDQKQTPVSAHQEDSDLDKIRAVEETFGTIVLTEDSDPRRMLRPQPSLDPNDPLVGRLSHAAILELTAMRSELAFVAKVPHLWHYMLLHIPLDREREQFQCGYQTTW